VFPVSVDNISFPRHQSVPHTAPDSLASTTDRQTAEIPYTPTLAEVTADIEASILDQCIASLKADHKLLLCRPDQFSRTSYVDDNSCLIS
jgi:hypothetical protein